MLSSKRGRAHDDAGITLIELTVSAAISLIALSIIAGMFISTSTAGTAVQDISKASASGQLTSSLIDRAARNSSGIAVTSVGSDQLVRARTVGSGTSAVWGCTAWYYSASDKTIRYTTSTTTIAAPTSTTSQRSWSLLSGGVSPASGSSVFVLATNTGGGQTLTTTFAVAAGKSSPATFSAVSSNKALPSGDLTCF